VEEALLLAQDGERENANVKLSSNIAVVVMRSCPSRWLEMDCSRVASEQIGSVSVITWSEGRETS
jgi:hypothetical protein